MRRKPTILVTGGPTRAYLDDVRFLSNLSTGSLAFEVCRQLKKRGAEVVAIIGPTALNFESLKLKSLVRVETNREMHQAVLQSARRFKPSWGIFSAAVLDFEPAKARSGKVSSDLSQWTIQLRPAPKILDDVKKHFPSMKRVGFKLESERRRVASAKAFADSYRVRKKLEVLCYNEVQKIGRNHEALILNEEGEWRVRGKNKIAAILVKLALLDQ